MKEKIMLPWAEDCPQAPELEGCRQTLKGGGASELEGCPQGSREEPPPKLQVALKCSREEPGTKPISIPYKAN